MRRDRAPGRVHPDQAGRPPERLTDAEVRWVLAQASEREAEWDAASAAAREGARDDGMPVARLREAAVEAGISGAAFDAAVADLATTGTPHSRRGPRKRAAVVAATLAVAVGVGVMGVQRTGSRPLPPEVAERPPVGPAVCAPEGMPAEQLRALARQLHPQALEPANQARSLVVGLLFDDRCALTAHAVTRRDAERLDVDTTLGRLFPGVYQGRFRVAGIAEVAESQGGPGSPWIVWGVLPAPR